MATLTAKSNLATKTSTAKKKQLVAEICTEFTVHAQVEEEIFYLAVKKP